MHRQKCHRITESFQLEGTFRGHLVQPQAVGRGIFNWIRVLRGPSNLAWNVPSNGAWTTSLGNLCQGLTTLIVKNFFLLSSLLSCTGTGAALPQEQDPALGLVEPHEAHTDPLLQLAQVPLDAIPSRSARCPQPAC